MRSFLLVCAVVCLALVAGVANAAPGQVSDSTLAAFGLSGVQQMTDVQGAQIRGMGFAAVGGLNVAKVPGGTVAANGYVAVSARPNAVAAGASISVAATGVGVFPAVGNPSGLVIGSVAAGGAIAYAR